MRAKKRETEEMHAFGGTVFSNEEIRGPPPGGFSRTVRPPYSEIKTTKWREKRRGGYLGEKPLKNNFGREAEKF